MHKKNKSYLFYAGLFFITVVVLFAINSYANKDTDLNTESKKNNTKIVKTENAKPAEKVQVFLFHSTSRCSSCITAGKYTAEMVEQNFPEELKSGKIEFREINVDLPENKEIANKFKASGTSLFINPIIDGQDNIEEEVGAWRLLSDKQGFITHLSNKIKALI